MKKILTAVSFLLLLCSTSCAQIDTTEQVTIFVPPPPLPQIQTVSPIIVIETPIIIDERIWTNSGVWIRSYHGFRSPSGHVRYQSHVPFHSKFIRGEKPTKH